MPVVRFLLALAAAALVHFAASRALPVFPLIADLFLLVTLLVARAGRPLPAMLAGLAAGWVADTLSGGPFGLHGLADTMVGYGTARAAQQLIVQRKSSLLLVFAAGALAQLAILALLELAFLPDHPLPSQPQVLLKLATTAGLGLAWTALAGWATERFAILRRRRSSSRLTGPR